MADNLTEKLDEFAGVVGTDVGQLRRDFNLLRSQGKTLENNGQTIIQQPEPQAPSTTQVALATSQATTSFGVDRFTGQVISGWAHVQQSIQVILTTRIGSRLMRGWFGSEAPDLIDANGTQETFVSWYVVVAEALANFEPRFELTSMQIVRAGPDGKFAIQLLGTYFPRGHLGDRTQAQSQNTTAFF